MEKQYGAIDRMIAKVREYFGDGDQKVARIFENCISDTLIRTVKRLDDGSVYVITGDIPAMWLRDSSCQLLPFVRFANEEPEIMDILVELIRTQAKCINIDPYANAFNVPGEKSIWMSDKTDMKEELWERKYEIDSLSHPVNLAWTLWKKTGGVKHFTDEWKSAAKKIIETFLTEQEHEERSGYRFERANCVYTDTLSRGGRGALVKSGTGMIWSGFRPSDDACVYGYFVPGNMFASVMLEHIAEIAEKVYADAKLAVEAATLSARIRKAIGEYAVVPNTKEPYYAYEVDGYGQYLIMDDANMPSLLAMPLFGWCEADDPLYLNTRKVILSSKNPYYYSGKFVKGIGSPHTPEDYVWDISLAVQGLTATSREEKCACIRMMVDNDADTGLMHEGVYVDDPAMYTRPWFSWANSMYCELVMDYCGF